MVGFYFATHPDVTEEDSCIIVNHALQKDSVEFDYSLSDLEDGTTYYVRAFAKNNVGISFGEEKSFVTTEMLPPTVGEISIIYVSYTNAIFSSNVLSDGGGATKCGVCYALSSNPTIESNKIISGSGVGAFSTKMSNLVAGTTYYVRAFAMNNKGVVYSNQVEFTTKEYSLPQVTTLNVTKIKFISATCGGEVTSDGGLAVLERGICYSNTPEVSISNEKIYCGVQRR